MKKVFEKNGMLRVIGCLMNIIGIILFIVAAFISKETPDMVLKLVGLVLFIVGGMIVSVTSKEHQFVKSLLVIISASIIMTWLFPYGYFQGTDFYDYGMKRIGLVDIGFALYYSINFIMDKIVFLFVVTGFYGVLSKISGYQGLVEGLGQRLKNHPIVTTVVMSVLLFVMTSVFTQTFVVLLFIPLFISVLSKMNMDKLTAFAITFGSALVGILGCTYGTDSLIAFNHYIGQELSTGLTYRFIIAAVALVLYNFFLVMRVRKITKDSKSNKKNEQKTDPFAVEAPKEKSNCVPTIIVLAVIAIVTILGYVAWNNNFEISVFTKFHEWLIGLEAGKDFTIINYLLGSNANALGEFAFVFTISILLLAASSLLAFLYKMDINEYFQSFFEGTRKMFKPILYLMGAYVIFGICYLTPVVPTVVNWVLNLVEGFNPYLTAIMGFVTSMFQPDFGYTAYTVGGFLVSAYAENVDIVHTIFTSMYGLVGLFMPSSALLVVGLAMMNVNYKDWFKYIWLFAVGMIIILLVLFTVLTYI